MSKKRIFFGLLLFFISINFSIPVSAGRETIEENDAEPSTTQKKTIVLNPLKKIPPDILAEIGYKARPVDIVNLSMASKKLGENFSDVFWANYLIKHYQQNWDLSLPILKIVFSYSFFEEGKIEKAARLGFPQAIGFLEENKEIAQKGKKKSMKNKIRNYLKKGFAQNNHVSLGNLPYYLPVVFPIGAIVPDAYLVHPSTLGYSDHNFNNRYW